MTATVIPLDLGGNVFTSRASMLSAKRPHAEVLQLFVSPQPTLVGSQALIASFSQPHEIAKLTQYVWVTRPWLISCYVTGYKNGTADVGAIRKASELLTMR